MNDNYEMNWSSDAKVRVEKVPFGFMRKMTIKRIEEHAAKNMIAEITLKVVEDVIQTSKAGMGSMMGGDASSFSGELKHPEEIKKKTEDDDIYYFCFVCAYTVKGEQPEICPVCNSGKEKFSVMGKEFITEASMKALTWTDNAKKRISEVPDDYRKNMTRWEIEGFCRKKGYLVVSLDLVEERIRVWNEISKNVKPRLEWSDGVKDRIKNIPESIRGMVIKEMEKFAENKGDSIVNEDILDALNDKWGNTREFHVKWM